MAMFRLIVSLAPLLWLANGARMITRPQLDARTGNANQLGPESEPWEKGKLYACMQLWEPYRSKFVDTFCLANLNDALTISTGHLRLARDITRCQGAEDSTKMKVCALKGDTPENKHVSEASKAHVPKPCFRFSSMEVAYDVLEAAVDESACTAITTTEDQEILPNLAPPMPKLSPTTTTTTLGLIEAKSLFTTGPRFLWEYRGKAMKCCVSSAGEPTQMQDINAAENLPTARSYGGKTGCGRMFGDKYHNGMKSYKGSNPTCPLPASLLAGITFEAKGLFTSGEESLWEYNEKAFKCCVSSAGKPTMLQDMNAKVLPSARSIIWTKTGCGRMFGDTYHNGLKRQKGSDPSCPVPVTLLLEVAGDDYGSFAHILE